MRGRPPTTTLTLPFACRDTARTWWPRPRIFFPTTPDIEAALLLKTADLEAGAYGYLLDHFGSELSHEVLKKGSRLGRQLVEEAEKQGPEGGEEKVWKLLAEFWSEMLPYLAPSDNVKAHIQVLQRGGELITLLWVLLLHAGITSRPAPHTPEP
jgi:hypothetical protein